MAKFGESLSRGELQAAYGRAGNSFAGQLQQNFVVLHDKGEGNGMWELGLVWALVLPWREAGKGETRKWGSRGRQRGGTGGEQEVGQGKVQGVAVPEENPTNDTHVEID